MRLALIPLNPTVGDLPANARAAQDAIHRAAAQGADLIVLPELAVCGYPPRDLLLNEGFVDDCMRAVRTLAASLNAAAQSATVVIGAPWRDDDDPHALRNSLAVLRAGAVTHRYDKRLLPTYDVFDEDRYFTPGDAPLVIDVKGVPVGLSICEDLWRAADAGVAHRYTNRADPVAELVRAGAQLIVNPSASPFVLHKEKAHRAIVTGHVRAHNVAVAALNQHGANDDLVFNAHASLFVPDPDDPTGARLVGAVAPFTGDTLIADLPDDPAQWRTLPAAPDPYKDVAPEQRLWSALTRGVRDYCAKTGFTSAVIGLSGGIDSALVACIAAGALGAQNITGVRLPSRFSSPHSLDDAQSLADALRITLRTIPIEPMHSAAESALRPAYESQGLPTAPDLSDENMQSRLRALTLMAWSNKTGAILLTTGNKSELALGYCTLYGDMSGGLAVIADCTKRRVYDLSRWINANHRACGFDTPPIPQSTIDKPPSAELRPDQKDPDPLPPYDLVDDVVERYIEQRQSPARIAAAPGPAAALVPRRPRLIDLHEHTRVHGGP
ncbi:MAG: NAD+ synthase, partial [Phycisphaerales bacterium]